MHRRNRMAAAMLCSLLLGYAQAADIEAFTSHLPSKSGLIIYLGCTDGKQMIDLAQEGHYVIHGLVLEAKSLDAVRLELLTAKCYGSASVDHVPMESLPYSDNLANLVIVEQGDGLARQGLTADEILRVTAPLGRIMIKGAIPSAFTSLASSKSVGGYTVFQKPWPEEMDEWGMVRHSGSRHPVSRDKLVGPPNYLQWIAGPIWPIGFKRKYGLKPMLTAGGKCYFSTALEASNMRRPVADRKFFMVCRDAFNGTILWKRDGQWELLAAYKDLLLVRRDGITVVDGNTGKDIRSIKLESKSSLNFDQGILFSTHAKGVKGIDVRTGMIKWEYSGAVANLGPAGNGKIFCFTEKGCVALDTKTGEEVWTQPEWNGTVCFLAQGKLFSTHPRKRNQTGPIPGYVYSAGDGKRLAVLKNGIPGKFLINGLFWSVRKTGEGGGRNQFEMTVYGKDPLTGEVKETPTYRGKGFGGTTGCGDAMPVATERFILGNKPLNLFDVETGKTWTNTITRGGCGSGHTVGNGLLYSFPKGCHCWEMLRGFTAFSSHFHKKNELVVKDLDPNQRVKGPGFDKLPVAEASTGDWATFRHDHLRSGCTDASVPHKPDLLWTRQVEDQTVSAKAGSRLQEDWSGNPAGHYRLTAAVANQDMVFTAMPQSHRVVALKAATGETAWTFVCGARVEIPPTLSQGLCLFGSQDGWVYCLNAATGQLIWKFRAAPADKRLMAYGQIESSHPVVSGVLVAGNMAYIAAGRASAIDGGIQVYALNPKTGDLIWKTILDGTNGWQDWLECKVNDVLVLEGRRLFIAGYYVLDPKTGKRMKERVLNTGLYGEPNIVDRTWRFSTVHKTRGGGVQRINWMSGQLIVSQGNRGFVFRLHQRGLTKGNGGQLLKAGTSQVAAVEKTEGRSSKTRWSFDLPPHAQVEAMMVTKDKVFAAGPVDSLKRDKGKLWIFSKEDGNVFMEMDLEAPPAAEGLTAVADRVYVALQNGKLICLGRK